VAKERKHRVKGYSYQRGGKTIRVKSHMSGGRKSGHSWYSYIDQPTKIF